MIAGEIVPPMTALLIATRNAHKTREIQQVLAGSYQYLTLDDFLAAPAVIEDGATFSANAGKSFQPGRLARLRTPNCPRQSARSPLRPQRPEALSTSSPTTLASK